MSSKRNTASEPSLQPGVGRAAAFTCPRCNKRRQAKGWRIRHFLGLRTWVCAACHKALAS